MTQRFDNPAIVEAAEWLAANRQTVSGAIIPYIRQRFRLSNLEAIEAVNQGHLWRHGVGRDADKT